ncbi:MAG: hypothetical protein NT062_33960 [Proteobacteria bacterium]|nr:hypothetical protein [Pseudomonadota bacterium]
MRIRLSAFAAIVLLGGGLGACGKSAEQKGLEAAKEEEAKEQAEKKARGQVAKTQTPPIPGNAKIPCEQLIDPAVYTAALGEKEPLTVRDDTSKDGEAAASCSLIRGGKKLTKPEQDALLKKQPRLGVLPGDPLCQITVYGWTFENAEHFRARCAERKEKDDDTMGSYACVQVVATGVDDVQVFRFFDEDTKTTMKAASAGPNVDNDQIRTCAKLARDHIGPDQIKVVAK